VAADVAASIEKPKSPSYYQILICTLLVACAALKAVSLHSGDMPAITRWLSSPVKWVVVMAEIWLALLVLRKDMRLAVLLLRCYAVSIVVVQLAIALAFPSAETCGCLGVVRSRGVEMMVAGVVAGCCLHFTMHNDTDGPSAVRV
jgi:hypothetical protein